MLIVQEGLVGDSWEVPVNTSVCQEVQLFCLNGRCTIIFFVVEKTDMIDCNVALICTSGLFFSKFPTYPIFSDVL